MTEDLWQRFVYNLIELKKKNVEESTFHVAIEDQLQLLGWAKYNGEINHKLVVPIGNHNFIQPDITIGKQPDWKFVIEVKKPNHKQQTKDVEQLTSYMRQLKVNVGLYFGEYIEIFYDTPNTKEKAKSAYKVEFKLDNNKRGEIFVDLFKKENFTKESLSIFCDDCLKAQEKKDSLERLKAYLISEGGAEIKRYVLKGLQEKYSGKFTPEDLAEMLKTINFSANENSPKNGNSPNSKIKDSKIKVKVILKRNNLHSVGIFDGKGVTIKAGSQISEESTPSYLRKEWRNNLIHAVAHHINGKLILAKDVSFNSPSCASSFCLGTPSNGRHEWIDENGLPLASYINKHEK